MSHFLRHLCAPLVLCALSPAALAQLIEDIDLHREGGDAVATVRFVTPVQFQRVVLSRSGDLGQAFYRVLPTRESIGYVGSQRRVAGAGGVPEFTVVDEAVATDDLARRLIVKLSRPVPYRLRAGKGNRAIDLVFPGLGADVAALQPAKSAAPVAATGPVITLQSADKPGFFLEGRVPAQLGAYPVFTAERRVDGRRVYDIRIGPFPSRAVADEALALLQPSFPAAVLIAPPADTAVAAAPLGAPGDAEVRERAAALLAQARAAAEAGRRDEAIAQLGQLLDLPPTPSTREAMGLIGELRQQQGDNDRARAEYDAFLALYPVGPDSDLIRRLRDRLPTREARTGPRERPTERSWSGSVAGYYFGGQAKERSQEFQDSPISGLPELVGDNSISSTDQGQFQSSVDLNWRERSTERDARFVYRDAYTANFQPNKPNRRRLTALYYDQKSFINGTQFRVGRQSPTGGGVLYRFDGATAGYTFAPKWRINAVAGAPTDDLLDTRRRLYGAWIDADALTTSLSGSLYFNRQTIDGEVDRQAVGTELRYFNGGLSLFSQLDYDTALRGMNITSVQGTWQNPENTVVNFLYDKRNAPLLSLGNILFFQDPTQPTLAQRITDLLGTSTVPQLREQVKAVTALQTQAQLGVTTPLNDTWQVGGDLGLTRVGELPAVPAINFPGQAATGNLYSTSARLIGSNLYSTRDTHVFMATLLTGPTYRGHLLSYNNLSSLGDGWRLEPSLRYYRQSDTQGVQTVRWTPSLRASYKLRPQATLETEITWERTQRDGPTLSETSNRLFYMLGARYDF